MKNWKKVIVGVIIFAMILTVTAYATSYKKMSKELEACEYEETSGYLVIETSDGAYVIEFDDDAGYFGFVEFDEDGNVVDEQYLDYDTIMEENDVDFVGITFLHN